MIYINDLWNKYKAGKISQSDYELSFISHMVYNHRNNYPRTGEHFEDVFESIILKLADLEILSDRDWEQVQRLYFLNDCTVDILTIQKALGYDSVEVIQ